MKLLEIVSGPETSAETLDAVCGFADVALGKNLVRCEDSPGFIANRLGITWMMLGLTEALDLGLTVEEADLIIGRPMGIPRTGIFGLFDLVGIDLMPHVNASMGGVLPASDAFHAVNRDVPLLRQMIAAGLTGRKGKGGFYRMDRVGGQRVKLSMDLVRGTYRDEIAPVVPEAAGGLQTLLAAPGKFGTYAFRVLGQTISYAATLVPEAAGSIADIDEAMRLGYAWRWGPFELADTLGVDWLVDRLKAAGIAVPGLLAAAAGRSFYRVENGRRQYLGLDGAYHDLLRAPGVLLLADVKLGSAPVLKNGSAALWDVGDGVACFEITTRSQVIDAAVLALLHEAIAVVSARFKALVIYNEGGLFSAGADLRPVLAAAKAGDWAAIEAWVEAGQKACRALRYAPFPVVAAPAGTAVGAGCELVLWADAVQAAAETNLGFDACAAGLVPAWGGCALLAVRLGAAGALASILGGVLSRSAHQAADAGLLRASDGISMNRDRLLADAKARALALVAGYVPPAPAGFKPLEADERIALAASMGESATAHDRVVADAIAGVLTGGPTEQAAMEGERAAFMRLVRMEATQARMAAVLQTGKPLRN